MKDYAKIYGSEVLQLHSLTSTLDSRFRLPNRSDRFIRISYCTGEWVDHGCLRKFDDSAMIHTQHKNQSLFTEPPYRLLRNPSTMGYGRNYIYMKTVFFFLLFFVHLPGKQYTR